MLYGCNRGNTPFDRPRKLEEKEQYEDWIKNQQKERKAKEKLEPEPNFPGDER